MESGTSTDPEEVILTDPESEEVDERFYINRLMLGTTEPFSSPSLLNNPLCDNGISPQIARLPQRGLRRPVENSQIIDSVMIHTESQNNTISKNEKNLNTEESQDTVGPAKEGKTPQCHLSHHMCTEEYAGGLRRSPRINSKTYGQISEIKPQGQPPPKDKDGNSKSRNSSSQGGGTVKAVDVSHPSTRGQQRPAAGVVNQKTEKVLSLPNIQKRNQFGETLLHRTVMKGDVQSVRDMVKVGVSVNVVDNAGWTPLHEAVLKNDYTMAETLIQAGALVNSVGHGGITPLHDAVGLSNIEIVRLLLKNGANPLMKTEIGDSAIDISEDKATETLLRKYTASSSLVPSVSSTTSCVKSEKPGTEACTSTRQLFATEIEACVGPDSADAAHVHNSPKVKPSGQTTPQAKMPPKSCDGHGFLLVRELKPSGLDTLLGAASDSDSDVTVDFTEEQSPSPGHWALSATQDFSRAIHN
ncbi:ankyrin repeat domain-containing protein 31 isoform X2 [Trichomycterus rosablanca]|uniref:ankyrin repeat domain-containing protein 31 isoform X2 n=1 Tax=Trichomycterus rosablanca TaxID=2290929 RepID=UPI002F356A24